MVGIRLGNREGTHHVLVAREARRERVLSVGETRNKETALGVADSPLENLGIATLINSKGVLDFLSRMRPRICPCAHATCTQTKNSNKEK